MLRCSGSVSLLPSSAFEVRTLQAELREVTLGDKRQCVMGNANSAQFPYDIGEVVAQYDGKIFKMREGKKKDSGEQVTIFTFEKKSGSAADLRAAQNFHLRLKTIRHPHVLRYVDGVELESDIHVVTEYVRPFDFPRTSSQRDIE
eukprot:1391959-Amorphochlora_amoeboformis.AAC.1